MKKIPTLFRRNPDDMRYVLPEVTPGCEWVLRGEGVVTRKYDGTCVLIRRDGLAVLAFGRREVKPGKEPPDGFIEVDHDLATGKRVGWVRADLSTKANRWLYEAVAAASVDGALPPGTYELCGPRINGNPEAYDRHVLVSHEMAEQDWRWDLSGPQTFPVIRNRVIELGEKGWEGVVWHHPDGRMAKLKARDLRDDE